MIVSWPIGLYLNQAKDPEFQKLCGFTVEDLERAQNSSDAMLNDSYYLIKNIDAK